MNKQKHFELLISDHDTALFRAAKFVQEDYIIVTHKKTGEAREYKNRTAFYGHHFKKEGGWLGDTNAFIGTSVKYDEFDIEEFCRLRSDIGNHLDEAERNFDFTIGALRKLNIADDYRIVIGGSGNFRYDIARELPYKGGRKDKPLLFSELKELVLKKYKNKVIVANGREADDVLSEMGKDNYLNFLETGKWKYCLSYLDKDLKMVVSPHIDPDNLDEGIIFNTPLEAALAYASQLLTGDFSVDNIAGLPNMSEELREKYGVKRGRGVGKITADAFLSGCKSAKEAFERVVEAYKDYYGEGVHTFINYKGEELSWTWKEFLQERSALLWMYRDKDCKYNIFTDTFDKLKVLY